MAHNINIFWDRPYHACMDSSSFFFGEVFALLEIKAITGYVLANENPVEFGLPALWLVLVSQ